MRKTKIVCTMGPATRDEEVLRQLMLEGMNVARFNFSHGDHASHKEMLDKVVKLRTQLGLPIAAMLDTKGPEIRLGTFKEGKAQLKKGSLFTLYTAPHEGDENGVSISYPGLPGDVKAGGTILLDDGLIALLVEEVTPAAIRCRVMNDGQISNTKGVNVPGAHLSMPFISERDRSDILFAIENGFDFIAASFVRSAEDVLEIRRIFEEQNSQGINIIAKIENQEGVANIDEIIRVADGIMVARGDMGVEIPFEEVPILQKDIVQKVYDAGKQVITATQMLESMIKNPRPTRAEAADIANAVYDGTSALMLSGETAAGAWPVEAVRTMARIAERTERDIDYHRQFKQREVDANPDVTAAISHATCTTAHDLGAAAIITVTKSGRTARMISKFRPHCPIIGFTVDERACRQLNLSWGVTPMMIEEKESADELFDLAVDTAERAGLVKSGELVALTAGMPLGVSGTTNMMKVHVVGHVLATGRGVGKRQVRARICVWENADQARRDFREGDILVADATTNEMLPQLRRASGIITQQGGMSSHGAIVGLSLDIPVLMNAAGATRLLHTGAVVTLDAERGVVLAQQKD